MNIKIDLRRLDIVLAEKEMGFYGLRGKGIAVNTLHRIRQGKSSSTRTIGKLANALNVPVERIIADEIKEEESKEVGYVQ